MKTILLLLLSFGSVALAEMPKIDLEPNEDDTLNFDYGDQLVEKFNALLKSNDAFKALFASFEKAPKERAGGRYLGHSTTPFVLHRSVNVDFQDSGGKRGYEQTLVLYCSFTEGMRKGMQETSGVFAVFRVAGHQSFEHKGGDEFKLVAHTVTAQFEGFQQTLDAEQVSADQPASAVGSNADRKEKTKPESEGRSQ